MSENERPALSIDSFETGELDASSFDHEAHIYIAWKYLQLYPLGQSADRFTRALKDLTTSLGEPEKYHETISWFFIVAISERLSTEQSGVWTEFKQQNADLFNSKNFLFRYYSKDVLESDKARSTFVLPDKVGY